MSGVKSKELFIWVTLSDIYVDDPPTEKITFQTPAGLSRTFVVSAFELEEKSSGVKEDSAKVKETSVCKRKVPMDMKNWNEIFYKRQRGVLLKVSSSTEKRPSLATGNNDSLERETRS
ncbi:hypothetical protein KIW84_030663 [Lathyrus oleraceus]|uniref:Uncharacterized protein n=1 Tax=Pisum sativum TaxID=3888 RepID=A0A9D5AZL5_PEA|nr:hypothetical protein KIW84_030663 [Pisum sativum]